MKLNLDWFKSKETKTKPLPDMPTIEFEHNNKRMFFITGVYTIDKNGNVSKVDGAEIPHFIRDVLKERHNQEPIC